MATETESSVVLGEDATKWPAVAIIVLNWNNYEDTAACLDSLSDVRYPNYTLIVIDNGSTDGSGDQLEQQYRDQVDEFIKNEANLGYAGGNNVGIASSLSRQADYVLLLNNDTVVSPGFLRELVSAAEGSADVGIVGPKVLDSGSEEVQSTGFRQSTLFPFYKRDGPEDAQWKCDYVHGCCVLISSDVFERVGLLDDAYFLYVEERDFYIRAKRAGYDIVMNPESVVYHEGMGSCAGDLSPIAAYWKIRNLFRCWRKHFPSWYLLVFVPYMAVFSVIHLELYGQSFNELRGIIPTVLKAWVAGLTSVNYDQEYRPE